VPHDRKEAIRENLVAAQLELTQVLDRVGPDDRSRIGPNEGWTVRDLLTRLITSETGFVSTIRRMSADDGGVPVDFDPKRERWSTRAARARCSHCASS